MKHIFLDEPPEAVVRGSVLTLLGKSNGKAVRISLSTCDAALLAFRVEEARQAAAEQAAQVIPLRPHAADS